MENAFLYTALSAMILLTVVGCQQETPQPTIDETRLPTLLILDSPTPDVTAAPTSPVEAEEIIPETETPTATITASNTATNTPTITPTPTATLTAIVIPTLPPVTPSQTPVPLPDIFGFGRSVQGRDLIAYRMGNGPNMIMLVGGVHGGWEANTTRLMDEMKVHFEITPGDLLPGITLVIVPLLNPDGLEAGRTLQGRFNARGVDLNRNWGCGWEPTAFFREQQVSPGTGPFSEPETIQLGALINQVRPSIVLFYHSAANGIFEGRCEGISISEEMARVLGEATGYPFGQEFTDYVVTGTAPSWVNGIGIPSADVELASTNATELDRNIRGVVALQCWLLGASAQGFPACGG